MPYSFPIGYRESECYLVPIRAALIPFVAGALRQFEAREAWATEADYEQAYNAFAEVEAAMMQTCASELIESNRQIYRLLDTIFNKRSYTLVSSDPLVISPAIPAVPQETDDELGIVKRLLDTRNLLDNAINGTRYPNYDSGTSMRVDLARIRELIEQEQAGENREEVLAALQQIALLLA